jgi:hypothetical protein
VVQSTFIEIRSAIEATKRELLAQLEVVEARTKQGRGPGVCANVAQLPTSNRTEHEGPSAQRNLRRQYFGPRPPEGTDEGLECYPW